MSNPISASFQFDEDVQSEPNIRVIGVGGGGGNAINNMIEQGIHGIEFVAINTDAQALANNQADVKIQVGRGLTKGLGAGARPKVGAEAVEESRDEVEAALQDCDMVFITAGMGGGTGTGGAPMVAALAKQMGILTVAIVTRPFACEGPKRLRSAEQGIELLKDNVDTLIVISNERLLEMDADATLQEAFLTADEVLYNATRGISELITVHGLINLDFADVRTTMKNKGTALMGAATCSGENRARRAAEEAIKSPLLEGLSIVGAENVLVNVTAGPSLKINEAMQATSIIQQAAGDDAEIIMGTVIDEEMGETLRVTVIATGFSTEDEEVIEEELMPEEIYEPRPRRTHLLDDTVPVLNYKGADNLKALDAPAYERRSAPWQAEAPAKVEPSKAEKKAMQGKRSSRNVRRVDAAEFEKRRADKKGDKPEQPAFIRKMLD